MKIYLIINLIILKRGPRRGGLDLSRREEELDRMREEKTSMAREERKRSMVVRSRGPRQRRVKWWGSMVACRRGAGSMGTTVASEDIGRGASEQRRKKLRSFFLVPPPIHFHVDV